MKREGLLEELYKARSNNFAVGAFNIFNYLSARSAISAARRAGTSVILQTSVQTVLFWGVKQLGSMLRQLADDMESNEQARVFIHLDHCRDLELAKACADNGWDSVMYDGSELPVEENIKNSRELAAYAHSRGICVEGEIGKIAGVEDDISVAEDNAQKTSVEEAVKYAQASGVDLFAPAVGTAHGMYCGQPEINFELIEQLKGAISQPIVIHGGTGLQDEVFLKLIEKGAAKINVSTAIKHAYSDGAREYFRQNPDKTDPIGLDRFLSENIEAAVLKHIRLFGKVLV